MSRSNVFASPKFLFSILTAMPLALAGESVSRAAPPGRRNERNAFKTLNVAPQGFAESLIGSIQLQNAVQFRPWGGAEDPPEGGWAVGGPACRRSIGSSSSSFVLEEDGRPPNPYAADNPDNGPGGSSNGGSSPPKSEPPKNEPPKNEPPKNEPPKNEPPKNEPPKNEPPKNEPPKNEPPKNEPPKNDGGSVGGNDPPGAKNCFEMSVNLIQLRLLRDGGDHGHGSEDAANRRSDDAARQAGPCYDYLERRFGEGPGRVTGESRGSSGRGSGQGDTGPMDKRRNAMCGEAGSSNSGRSGRGGRGSMDMPRDAMNGGSFRGGGKSGTSRMPGSHLMGVGAMSMIRPGAMLQGRLAQRV